ncbi:uncharacterized protein CELE_F55D1.1 [Caenorhabditis elegans]|uniref:Uncharacterized protein n=1 Tax=Caenorhabditis elegans TaxID=6239 RepID=Q20825_CAEEL|nr:Uncharacterized protein CELE_F55D1.1 [Caenorhabditis elegans]CCD65688.1 Uncharacterized protein CELE_F55D1.1 [Caenorhabditis elegans]|eukprot:NP_508931.1 Uncharacterized protein CELE_F55D1.1 [Caenorhabditis elegans]
MPIENFAALPLYVTFVERFNKGLKSCLNVPDCQIAKKVSKMATTAVHVEFSTGNRYIFKSNILLPSNFDFSLKNSMAVSMVLQSVTEKNYD